jgi:predicted aspartyl protease
MTSRRRFLSCALCGPFAGFCQVEAGTVLPISRTKTGLAVVPVSAGRVTLRLVADTGASGLIISKEALSRLAPGDFVLHGAVSPAAAGGQARGELVTLRSVAVVPGTEMSLEGTVVSFSGFGEHFGGEVDGVLGMGVLEQYSLRFDLRRQRLALLPPQTRSDAGNALADLRFEFDPTFRQIRFPAQIDGQPVTAVLDTGAVQTCVNWSAARQAGVDRNSSGLREEKKIVGLDGGRQLVREYRFREVRILQAVWRGAALAVADLPVFETIGLASVPAAIFGMDLMTDHEVEISFSARRLIIR